MKTKGSYCDMLSVSRSLLDEMVEYLEVEARHNKQCDIEWNESLLNQIRGYLVDSKMIVKKNESKIKITKEMERDFEECVAMDCEGKMKDCSECSCDFGSLGCAMGMDE